MDKKKNDMLLLLIILVIASVIGIVWNIYNKQETGVKVVVSVDGKEYGVYALEKNRIVEIQGKIGKNVMEIKDGAVTMIQAVCPDQHCVQHKAIDANGEKIICLPGTIIIEIVGGENDELDSIVG